MLDLVPTELEIALVVVCGRPSPRVYTTVTTFDDVPMMTIPHPSSYRFHANPTRTEVFAAQSVVAHALSNIRKC
jgi:hypothetical protein